MVAWRFEKGTGPVTLAHSPPVSVGSWTSIFSRFTPSNGLSPDQPHTSRHLLGARVDCPELATV